MSKKIITIGRQFGSGGRELGRRLAENLGYAYYDQEILSEIAERTELSEKYEVKNEQGEVIETYIVEDLGDSYKLLALLTSQSEVEIPDYFTISGTNDKKYISKIAVDAFTGSPSLKTLTLPAKYDYYEDLTLKEIAEVCRANTDYFIHCDKECPLKNICGETKHIRIILIKTWIYNVY